MVGLSVNRRLDSGRVHIVNVEVIPGLRVILTHLALVAHCRPDGLGVSLVVCSHEDLMRVVLNDRRIIFQFHSAPVLTHLCVLLCFLSLSIVVIVL